MPRNLNRCLAEPAQTSVLVVDDEAHVRDILARWLASAGYYCIQAANAGDASRLLQNHDIQLVRVSLRRLWLRSLTADTNGINNPLAPSTHSPTATEG